MTELHVRNVPPELHGRLRERAMAEGRSMSAEVISLLRQTFLPSDNREVRQRAAIERLRDIRRRSSLSSGVPSAEQLVREDRDAAG